MDFKLITQQNPAAYNTELAIADTTVIERGDMVTLTSGLVTKWVAASTALAYALEDHASWDWTTILVCNDPDAIYEWTADANFAATNRWAEVDLVGTTTQLIDLWTSVTDVFKILPWTTAWTVWAATWVRLQINKTL